MSHSTPLMGIVPVDFQAVGSLALSRSDVGMVRFATKVAHDHGNFFV